MSCPIPHAFDTTDLYEAAYFAYNGFRTEKLRVSDATTQRQAVFTFVGNGEELARTQAAYFSGDALVNLREYRAHLETLKDRMFKVVRSSQPRRTRRAGACRG